MKHITLLVHSDQIEETRRALTCHEPYEGADYVIVEEWSKCPHCKRASVVVQGGGVGIKGVGRKPSQDDRAWEARAVTTCCKKHVGTLRVEANTLFGVTEDAAVLSSGNWKVY